MSVLSAEICKTPHFRTVATPDFETKRLLLQFEGILDEQVKINGVFDYISRSSGDIARLVFDLGGVTRVSSAGIQEWLFLIRRLKGSHLPFEFSRVSEGFLDQANQHLEMLGPQGTPVHTFVAPYFCASCQTRVTHEMSVEVALAGQLPTLSCDVCRTAMTFDEIEGDYLAFLTHVRPKSRK